MTQLVRVSDVEIRPAVHRTKPRRHGRGKSWQQHVIDQGKANHRGATAVDLDGDGALDIVGIVSFAFRDLHIWRNDNRQGK